MIDFGLCGYKTKMSDWAKHHKEVSVLVKREYGYDKKSITTEIDTLLHAMEENESSIMQKGVTLRDRKTLESSNGTDYYLPLTNLNYIDRSLEDYSIGASNTSHDIGYRAIFKVDYIDVIFDFEYKTSGSFATNFREVMDKLDISLRVLAENENKDFADKGIKLGENEGYYIVGVDEYKQPIEFEVSERELMNSLVCMEIYHHHMEID